MKKYLNEQKSKTAIVSAILILLISCFTIFTGHDIAYAGASSITTVSGSVTVEEIAGREKYNSCDYGIVTPNLDQGNTNICWAYATASSSEISVLKDTTSPPGERSLMIYWSTAKNHSCKLHSF